MSGSCLLDIFMCIITTLNEDLSEHYHQRYQSTASVSLIVLILKSSFIAHHRIVIIVALLLASGSDAAPMDYNNYSNTYDVWAYYYGDQQLEEIYAVEGSDPSQMNTDYVELSYLNYPNNALPVMIVSKDFTSFLKSISVNQYKTAIKPILIHAIIQAAEDCIRNDVCDEHFLGYVYTEDFILAVKHILSKIVSIVRKSIYLEVFLKDRLYLWYDMYWSLDTTGDNKPIISSRDHFHSMYRTCYYGESIEMILVVRDTMRDMLKNGFSEYQDHYLMTLAKEWLECLYKEYHHSVVVLEKDSSWEGSFLHNLTRYVKAETMMTYMLNNIEYVYYENIIPHKVKRVLDYNEDEFLFEPLLFSLYLPTLVEPYLNYLKLVKTDLILFDRNPAIAGLPLNLTIFNEIVPLNKSRDTIAYDYFARADEHFKLEYSKRQRHINIQNITQSLGQFVKYITKTIITGYVSIHYPVFSLAHKSYNLGSSLYRLLYKQKNDDRNEKYFLLEISPDYTIVDDDFIDIDNLWQHTLPKDFIEIEDLFSYVNTNKIMPLKVREKIVKNYAKPNNDVRWAHSIRTKWLNDITEKNIIFLNNMDINMDELRQSAPTMSETVALLQNIRKIFIANNPLKFNINGVEKICQNYKGTSTPESGSFIAHHLKKLIVLYSELRHLRPYDFFSEQQNIVKFIKATYNLYNFRHFSYFQTYTIFYIQTVISILADPNFRYTMVARNLAIATIQISELTCKLKFSDDDLTSIVISIRSMWGGKKLLNRYAGESGVIYNHFLKAIEKKQLNSKSLISIYTYYRSKKHYDVFNASIEKLYNALEDPYFYLFSLLQDPVIFSKIIADLMTTIENKN